MTLKQPARQSSPVFDVPPAPSGNRNFLTRRLISLAGKPLLAEKHLPIQPSTSEFSRKCYSANAADLYKFTIASSRKYLLKSGFRCSEDELPGYAGHPGQIFAAPVPVCIRQSMSFPPWFNSSSLTCPGAHVSPSAGVNTRTAFSFYQHHASDSWLSPLPACRILSRPAPVSLIFPAEAKLHRLLIPETCAQLEYSRSTEVTGTMRKAAKPGRFLVENTSLATISGFIIAAPAFKGCCFDNNPLPIPPHDLSISNIRTEPDYSLTSSSRTPRFRVRLRPGMALFAPGNDIDGNFILESNSRLQLVVSGRLQRADKKAAPVFTAGKNGSEFRPPQPPLVRWQVEALKPSMSAAAGIRLRQREALELAAHPGLLEKSSKTAPDRLNGSIRPAIARDKMRLRLKLHRQPFSFIEPVMKPAAVRAAVSVEHISRPFIEISYRPVSGATFHKPDFKQAWNPEKLICDQNFVQKRSRFLIKSAAHARYTLKRLRSLLYLETFNRLRKIRIADNSLRLSLKLPVRKLPATFPHTRALRGRRSESFSNREQHLILLVSRVEFEDICLPMQKRRVQSLAGFFTGNLHPEMLKRRRKSMRMLRFKLQAIDDGFRQKPARALRRLFTGQLQFDLTLQKERIVRVPALESPGIRLREKPLQISGQLRLKKIQLLQHLPDQLQFKLPLPHMLAGVAAPNSLPQKNFIIPAAWSKTAKAFKCRLRLLPHPFGFPEFTQLPPQFSCLAGEMRFKVANARAERADLPGHFILRREKVYLPPISMKNPRRLLYTSINQANSPREFYIARGNAPCLQIDRPTAISAFSYPWLHPSAKTRLLIEQSVRQRSAARQRTASLQTRKLPEDKPAYFNLPATSSSFTMPQIKRLLLRARRFGIARLKPEQSLNALPSSVGPSFKHRSPALLRNVFRKYELDFGLYKIKDSFFVQEFPTGTPGPVCSQASFRARFRVLRFPYRPDFVAAYPSSEDFSAVEQLVEIQNDEFADEIRASEFVFQMPEVGGLLPDSCQTRFKTVEKAPITFTATKAAPQGMTFAYRRSPFMPKVTCAPQDLYHFINPDTFFRFAEKTGMRLRKAVRNYSFRHPAGTGTLQPPQARFTGYGLNDTPVAALSMDSLHWIIMLRSYISLTGPLIEFRLAPHAIDEVACFRHQSLPTESCQLNDWPDFGNPQNLTPPEFRYGSILPGDEAPEQVKAPQAIEMNLNCRQRGSCFEQQFSSGENAGTFLDHPTWSGNPVLLINCGSDQMVAKDQPERDSRRAITDFLFNERKLQQNDLPIRPLSESIDRSYRHACLPDWIETIWQKPAFDRILSGADKRPPL